VNGLAGGGWWKTCVYNIILMTKCGYVKEVGLENIETDFLHQIQPTVKHPARGGRGKRDQTYIDHCLPKRDSLTESYEMSYWGRDGSS